MTRHELLRLYAPRAELNRIEAEKMAGEKNIAAMALRLGDRIKEGHYFKSLYPIFAAGELIAFLAAEAGWGKPWKLYKIKLEERSAKFDGCSPDAGERYSSNPPFTIHRKGDDAKEAALFKLAEQRAKFGTKSELVAAQAAGRVEIAARLKRYREACETNQTARKQRLEGLESIAKRPDLTNFERDALEHTLGDLRNEVAHYQRQLSTEAA